MLTEQTFGLIALATVLTTLAGYILNDFYDQNLDSINKPNRVVWGRYLPRSMALIVYAGIVTAAHFLAFVIDHQLQPANPQMHSRQRTQAAFQRMYRDARPRSSQSVAPRREFSRLHRTGHLLECFRPPPSHAPAQQSTVAQMSPRLAQGICPM